MKQRQNSAADCLVYLARKLYSGLESSMDLQKLHELLYLSLREGYAIIQEPLFEGEFLCLPAGPCCLQIQEQTLDFSHAEGSTLSLPIKLVLNSVLEQYGSMDCSGLMEQIEQDSAWRQAKGSSCRECLIDTALVREDSRKINLLRSLWCMNHNTYPNN